MWEYKVAETDLHGGCIAELLKSYNEFELVSVIPNGCKVIMIFKRISPEYIRDWKNQAFAVQNLQKDTECQT